MSDITIRAAVAEDSPALTHCIDAAYAIYSERNIDLPDVSDGIATSIENESVWIAQKQGRLVGGVVLAKLPDHLRLENIAVHPDNTGNGIGKTLIRFVESQCLEYGLHEIRLSTHRDITENIKLYKHLGWHIIGDTGNKIQMSKTI